MLDEVALAHASLGAGDHQADQGADAVQLMTVHSAKGLEFNAVFLSGLEEGLFPHENSILESDGLEEERRLMYVAVTRARERLYVSFAQSRMLHGQTRYNLRSRFLEEIPTELVKWLTPPNPRSAAGGAMGGYLLRLPQEKTPPSALGQGQADPAAAIEPAATPLALPDKKKGSSRAQRQPA